MKTSPKNPAAVALVEEVRKAGYISGRDTERRIHGTLHP